MSHFFPTRRSSVLPTGGSRGAGARRRSCVAGLRLGGRPRRDALESACVILIDSSAWIEFLRDTGSPVCEEVDRLLADDIAICDVIRMEILAGARDDAHLRQLRGLLARATVLPTGAAEDRKSTRLNSSH